MIRNHLWISLFGITVCFVIGIVCREAIIGGSRAKPGQFPYNVALLYDGNPLCGGGIIGDKFILTSAHCILGDDDHARRSHITVLAGTDDTNRSDEHALIHEIKKMYVLKEFDTKTDISTGDIAVIQLKQPLGLSEDRHLKILELPKNVYEDYTDKTGKIAGFGWDWIKIHNNTEDGGRSDTYLRFAEVDVISENHSKYSGYAIPNKQICARKKKQQDDSKPRGGVCSGDGGSPLVYNGTTVIGILSLSPPACTEEDQSSIYTRVSHYLRFIHNAMQGIHHVPDIRIILPHN